jgi:hypothetical protein
MKKYALSAAIAAVGVFAQSLPASADKLDEVLSRLEAIEKNNAKLANENAALKARLNRVETTKGAAPVIVQAAPSGRAGGAPAPGGAPTLVKAASTDLDANGHSYLEHKRGDPLTFYTPGGEITAYGNIDVSLDDSSKDVRSLNLNGATAPLGNFGWMPAVSTNLSYLGVRGFQNLPGMEANFIYQLEWFRCFGDARFEGKQQRFERYRERRDVQPQHLYRIWIADLGRDQDRQDRCALQDLDLRIQSVRGSDRRL